MSRKVLACLAFLLPGVAAPGAALAQYGSSLPSWASGEWVVTLRGNVVASPDFPGSDELSVIGYPSMSLRRAGTPDRFSSPDDAISFGLIDTGTFRAGPSFRYIGARKQKDHFELIGLGDVPWTIEAGVFAELWPTDYLRARVDVRHGFHGHRGLVADFALDGVLPYGAFSFSAGPRLTLASSRFMDAYFSVSPFEANINGAPAYSASGGVKSVGLAGAVNYRFSPQWSTTGYVRYDRLVGDAGDSPIPQLYGSRNQFTVGASVGYTFNVRM